MVQAESLRGTEPLRSAAQAGVEQVAWVSHRKEPKLPPECDRETLEHFNVALLTFNRHLSACTQDPFLHNLYGTVQNGNDTIKSFKMAWGFSKHGVLPTEPGLLTQIYTGFNQAFSNLTSMNWKPKISLVAVPVKKKRRDPTPKAGLTLIFLLILSKHIEGQRTGHPHIYPGGQTHEGSDLPLNSLTRFFVITGAVIAGLLCC